MHSHEDYKILMIRPNLHQKLPSIAMSKTVIKSVCLVLLSVSVVVCQLPLPSAIQTCPRNDPNMSQCVRLMIENLRDSLRTGDYGGGFLGEGVDPLKLDDIVLQKPGLTGRDTNVVATGISNFVVEKLAYDPERTMMDVVLTVPKIRVNGDYVNNFNLGFINHRSQGKFKAQLLNLKLRFGFKGHHEQRNGETYMKIDNVMVIPKITQIKIRLENIFPGNEALGETILGFLNQNVDLFVPDVELSIKSTILRLFKNTAQRIFENVPLNVLHP